MVFVVEQRCLANFAKFSNDQLASAPALYRNRDSQIRIYGTTYSNQIIYRQLSSYW